MTPTMSDVVIPVHMQKMLYGDDLHGEAVITGLMASVYIIAHRSSQPVNAR